MRTLLSSSCQLRLEVVLRYHSLSSYSMQEETLPIDTIKYNSIPCNMLKELWSTLYSLYNSAYHYQVNKNILKELQPATTQPWYKFIAQELWNILKKCANNSIPSPNHVS